MQKKSFFLIGLFFPYFLYAENLSKEEQNINERTKNIGPKTKHLTPPLLPSLLLKNKVDARYQHLKMFSDALGAIEQSYYKKTSSEKLIESAIKGMVKDLDPNSFFMSAQSLKKLKNETKGQFKGWGIKVALRNQVPSIVSVIENSPAYLKGLKPGDQLISINGKKLEGLGVEEIGELIDSQINTQCSLRVKKEKTGLTHTVIVNAQVISLKSVAFKRLWKDYLYIKIQSFTQRTHKELRKILRKENPFKGLILDLRQNPGGVFYSAIEVVDTFLPKGRIVQIRGRSREYEKLYSAKRPGTRKNNFPILVIIDEQTASAAEIVASALQENKRALVLGRPSFGKGTVQSLIPITQSHVMKLTVANYYTPRGKKIQGQGIIPQIHVMEKKQGDSLLKKPLEATNQEEPVLDSGFSSLHTSQSEHHKGRLKIFPQNGEKNGALDFDLKLALLLLSNLDFKQALTNF